MTAKIHIERMMHRSSIAVLGETAATYALLKLIPSGAGGSRPMALNIALALDVSGSMYEEDGTGISRLQRVQDAANKALEELNPDDTMSVIAFGHNAGVLLPPTKISEKEKISDIIRKIDMFDVDPGGTAMDEGIALSMAELEKMAGPGTISQMVVLTDGETSGEQNCKVLAKKAAEKNINLSLMGVGTDWKAELIKELATLSNGKWYYIDVNQKGEAERIFMKEFQALAATGFTDVEMHLRPMKDIKLKRVRMVVPEIKELKLEELGERQVVAKLGALQHDQTSRYIMDLTVPKRPDGKYVIANVEITYDAGKGQRESSGLMPLEVTYTAAGHGYVNAEVMKHIDDIQFKEMSENLEKALADNNMDAAKKAAEQMEKKGEIMGRRAAKKTMLAKQVLDEMNAGTGRVSKKTMLAASDAFREASEMPAG